VRGGKAKWVLIAAIALVLVPFAILLVRLVHGPQYATSDLALIELRTRDVGTLHTPLVGVYSRYGWDHPGPLLFYALALPYRLLGANVRSLIAGDVLLNAAAVTGALLLCWRRGRLAGVALGAIVLSILLRALGGFFLHYPWNPFAVVLPMLVLALLAWSVACRDHWILPVALVVGSFVVQAHIGTALAAAALLSFALATFLFDARRGEAHDLKRVSIVSAIALGAVWIPPLVDQFTGGGNLGELWRYWTKSHTPTVGFTAAAKVMSSQLSIPAPWITSHETVNPFSGGVVSQWRVPFALLVLIAATVIAWRRRDRTAFALDVVALVLTTVAFISIARVVDAPYTYIVRWTWCAGAVTWLGIGWTAVSLLRDVTRRRVAFAGAAVVVGALTIATSVSAVRAGYVDPDLEQAMHVLHTPVLDAVRGSQPVLIEPSQDIDAGAISSALLLDLTKHGVRAGFEPKLDYVAGSERTVDPATARARLLVAVDRHIMDFARDPSYRPIATYDRLAPADRAYFDNIDDLLAPLSLLQRKQWADAHPGEDARYRKLKQHALRATVFEAPTSPSGGTG
jgi:hypothetical protein